MLMVLNLHSFHGYNHGEGLLKALDFLRESSSICAVDTFILISGYFGIKWRKKGCFNLLFQVLFYSFAVYGVCVALGVVKIDKEEFCHCFKAFYDSWGFITCYIVLYFVSPWLNAFCENKSCKQLLYFVITFFFAENIIMRDSADVLNYCLIYLIGRLIRMTNLVENTSVKSGMYYCIVTIIITVFSYLVNMFLHYDASSMSSFILAFSYASPFVILQAISLFLFFGKLQVQSRWINWCAASCLSIYLIHMHPAIKDIGYYNFTESLYEKPVGEHIALLLLLMICVFVCSILIDKVRLLLSDNIYALICKTVSYLPNHMRKWDYSIPKSIMSFIC